MLDSVVLLCNDLAMNKKTLHQKTLTLLRKSKIPVSEVAEKSKVKPRWLYNVINGVYEDPGVNKIERIYNYLSNAK